LSRQLVERFGNNYEERNFKHMIQFHFVSLFFK